MRCLFREELTVMSNAPKNASERTFQENFVTELKKYKWEAPEFLNGNKQKVTVENLINHWRKELNRINADQLEGVELTDNEFKQVMAKVNLIFVFIVVIFFTLFVFGKILNQIENNHKY